MHSKGRLHFGGHFGGHLGFWSSSSLVSFTQFYPTCGRMHLPALSLWPGCQPYRPRLVGGRRGGGPSYLAPRSRNPPTWRRRDSPISSSLFRAAQPCAPSANSSPTEPVLSRSSWQRLGHLQSNVDGGWHVCQAVFPELQSSAACRRVDCAHEALPRLLFFFFRYCAGQRFIAALSHTRLLSASSWLVME